MCRILHSTHALVSARFLGSDVATLDLTIVVSACYGHGQRLARVVKIFGSASAPWKRIKEAADNMTFTLFSSSRHLSFAGSGLQSGALHRLS
jgi:hypothetical protein